MVGLRCRAASIGGAAAPPYQFPFWILDSGFFILPHHV